MPDGFGYEDDFYLWTREQARRLRERGAARTNVDLDWGNLAEEIEGVGNSDRRELRSRLGTIIEHLLKLRHSPARASRPGWITTVVRERRRVRLLLEDSPSLRAQVERLSVQALEDALDDARRSLIAYGEKDAAKAIADNSNGELVGRVLEDDFIPHPPGAGLI